MSKAVTWRKHETSKKSAKTPWPPTVAAALAALLFGAAHGARAETVRVFAAASLTDVLGEIGREFEATGTDRVVAAFGASSTIAKQIENGAPADLFLSANEAWVSYLVERRLVRDEARRQVARNTLVLVAPADAPPPRPAIALIPGVDLTAPLGGSRLALADPSHVPAGIYGRAALEALGAWAGVAGRMAFTADARAALALVERGETSLGVVYASDAAASRRIAVVAVFPADSHPPIVYWAAPVLARDGPAPRRFMDFLASEAAAAIFLAHGFAPPP